MQRAELSLQPVISRPTKRRAATGLRRLCQQLTPWAQEMNRHCARRNTGYVVPLVNVREITVKLLKWQSRREELYDRLYSLNWGETTTNNYGFAPAEAIRHGAFQLQLYTELLKLLDDRVDVGRIARVLEISCGRGGGLGHLARSCRRRPRWSGSTSPPTRSRSARNAMRPSPTSPSSAAMRCNCRSTTARSTSWSTSRHRMPTATMRRSCARSGACCTPGAGFSLPTTGPAGRCPGWSSWRAAAGLAGELRDITPNVVSACELDAERRRRIIRAGLPWYARLLLTGSLEGYSGLPGTLNFERFRSGDRMYFLGCMSPCPQDDAQRQLRRRPRYRRRHPEPLVGSPEPSSAHRAGSGAVSPSRSARSR